MAQKYVNGELVDLTTEEETQIANDAASQAAEKAATGYIMDRKLGVGTTSGYISLQDQLDQLYHDINAGKFGADAKTGEWFVGITSVKTAFPKPS
tara:strand:- start:192 stop:476 length:285 start_codon:yes stop_codon:yes gene_type:complete